MEELQEKELGYYESGKTVSVTIQVPENNGEWTEKDSRCKTWKIF